MYRGLIDYLAFTYGFICKGRGRADEKDLRGIADGAHLVTKNAPAVLGTENQTSDDKKDLAMAVEMDKHIEEAITFLMNLEIC
jgi:hypothetical protein